MKSASETRSNVEEAYTLAVTRGRGCCRQSSCGGEDETSPKGVAAGFAGYSNEELGSLPTATVNDSFGCGNPLAFSQVQPGDVVLDLGSGAGVDLLLAAQRVGPRGRVIGVDMTEEMIARARRAIAQSGLPNVEVRRGLIEDLPVESNSVDWIISNCVVNLSPEKERVFAEIARVLVPGGRMLISDIVVESLPWWLRRLDFAHNSCVGGAISEAAYIAGLERAGLSGVEVRQRLVYDASQIAGIVISDLAAASRWLRLTGPLGRALIRRAAGSVAGRVWSAEIFARLPGKE